MKDQSHKEPEVQTAEPAVIDMFGLDTAHDQVVLVMHEVQEWDGTDERLHQIQERFNAYVSFVLDGEMTEAHPELAGKKARIELRCDFMPDEKAIGLLGAIHDQLELQDIELEVVVAEEGGCGSGCGCQHEH